MPIYQLSQFFAFPDPNGAEDGIVAVGGDLQPDRIIEAYKSGIFPWYNDDEPIIWWSPDPRCVLFPNELKVSASMRNVFRKNKFKVSFDTDFLQVIQQCARVRYKDRSDTWLNQNMIQSYHLLHRRGYAHSVEVWNQNHELVGGLYGVAIGNCFFGESMFYKETNASKFGFIALVQTLQEKGYELIDCQVHNAHLESLGATLIPRKIFLSLLDRLVSSEKSPKNWQDWKFEGIAHF